MAFSFCLANLCFSRSLQVKPGLIKASKDLLWGFWWTRFPFSHPTNGVKYSPSLRFNGHFPGEPGLAAVYWSKGWWRWWWQLDYWSYKSWKTPVESSPRTNQHPVFLQAGCPLCRPTNSVKALKAKYHIQCSCLPQTHLGVFQLCLWPLVAPGYLGGCLPCLSSAPWCQYP